LLWYSHYIVGFFGCETLPHVNLLYDRFFYVYPGICVTELVFSIEASIKMTCCNSSDSNQISQ